LLRIAWGDGVPLDEVFEETEQAGRCVKVGSRGLNVTHETYNRSHQLAGSPEAELVAIGIDEIRERLKFLPLLLVVTIFERPGISTLAGALTSINPMSALWTVIA